MLKLLKINEVHSVKNLTRKLKAIFSPAGEFAEQKNESRPVRQTTSVAKIRPFHQKKNWHTLTPSSSRSADSVSDRETEREKVSRTDLGLNCN